MKPTPTLSAMSFTSRRCSFTSSQVCGYVQRRAGQFELPARLEADIAPSFSSPMSLPPSSTGAQPCRSRSPSSTASTLRSPVVGNRQEGILAIAELLVLGADAPVLGRLAAGGEIFRQLCVMLDRPAAGLGDGHARASCAVCFGLRPELAAFGSGVNAACAARFPARRVARAGGGRARGAASP